MYCQCIIVDFFEFFEARTKMALAYLMNVLSFLIGLRYVSVGKATLLLIMSIRIRVDPSL